MLETAYSIAYALSVPLNAVSGGRAGEAFSYRCAKARRAGRSWDRIFCVLFDIFDRDHCEKTIRRWERFERFKQSELARKDASENDREARGLRP